MSPRMDEVITVGFEELLIMCNVAWRPVLELLAKEGDYSSIDFAGIQGHPWPLAHTRTFPMNLQDIVATKTPSQVRFLTVSEVLRIHDTMVEEFGGVTGIRDLGILESSLYRSRRDSIFGISEFPTIIHRAAWLMHSIALYHPFLDGQKRTAVSCAFVFLGLNGFTFWSRDVADEIRVAVNCAEGKIEVGEIARWMSDRVLPLEETLFIAPYTFFLKRISPQSRCPYCDKEVRWRTLLNQCDSCGKSYQVRLRAYMLASRYTEDAAGDVFTSEAIAPVQGDEELRALRKRQDEIDSANESAAKLIRSLGLDPSDYMLP